MSATTRWGLAVAVLLVGCVPCVAAEPGPQTEGEPAGKVVLSTNTLWRTRLVFEPEEVLLKSGQVKRVRLKLKGNWRKVKTIEDFEAVPVPFLRLPARTSKDWMMPDFDDSDWARAAGPLLLDDERRVEWKLLLLRGTFGVTDPARAKGLKLSVDHKGGIVVWLNGCELVRRHMPEGPLDMYACADPDPPEAFLFPDGYLGMREIWRRPFPDWVHMLKARVRRLREFRIPPARLRKGRNVLAVAIHRPPARWQFYTTRIKPWPYGAYDSRSRTLWSRVALHKIELVAPADGAVTPNLGRHKTEGLAVWNQSVARKVFTSDYDDPFAPLRPVRIAAVRNGTFTGQVVVGSDSPIRGLGATVTDLAGPGVVPASAVGLLYGLPDGHLQRARRPWFDTLDDVPPAEVPLSKEANRAIVPVWIKVAVPADARAGDYRGALTVRAAGVKARRVPVHLRVLDWTLPDPARYTVDMDYFQSPESVAMRYEVPLWSEAHWKRMARSFALMKPLAARTLYVTCIRRTQLGNEHAMVRWKKGPGGKLTPDLSIAERYLDLALKYLGRIPAVILYVWEPSTSGGEYGWRPGRTHDREILISVVGEDGALQKAKGPDWGTPECRAFWRTLTRAMRAALQKRGLADSMMFGLLGDHRATKQAMDDITQSSPQTKWVVHSHDYCSKWQGYEVGMCAAFWGCCCAPVDPAVRRGYGWKNRFWLLYNPRDSMTTETQLARYRTVTELWLGASQYYSQFTHRYTGEVIVKPRTGVRGIGRQGIDFWKVLGRKSRRSKWSLTLIGRYPESEWGHLNFARGVPYLTGPGTHGAAPTVRYEGLRENLQECEARIFIEKALLDKSRRARLGEALARRAQDVLDARTRCGLYLQYTCFNYKVRSWPFFVTGWEDRAGQLFATTAAVARALGE
jgi:hypothetical protein